MAVLLLAEHDNSSLSDQTKKAVTAAIQIGGDVVLLVAGSKCASVATQASMLAGVTKVITVDDERYSDFTAESIADLIVSLSPGYETIVAASTTNGKTVMPRVAALLDVMQVSEVTRIVSPDTFERPIYAGNAIELVQAPDSPRVITIRTAGFSAVGGSDPSPIVVGAGLVGSNVTRVVSVDTSRDERPDLSSAAIVVSGGRGVGSEENFKTLIVPLADRLGAAVGASRAAVDAGYAPNDLQVGQTGKVVAPEIYFAIGISGAIQHLAGMKDSGIIVAINSDDNAPIFDVADFGLVADLFVAVPQLVAGCRPR